MHSVCNLCRFLSRHSSGASIRHDPLHLERLRLIQQHILFRTRNILSCLLPVQSKAALVPYRWFGVPTASGPSKILDHPVTCNCCRYALLDWPSAAGHADTRGDSWIGLGADLAIWWINPGLWDFGDCGWWVGFELAGWKGSEISIFALSDHRLEFWLFYFIHPAPLPTIFGAEPVRVHPSICSHLLLLHPRCLPDEAWGTMWSRE